MKPSDVLTKGGPIAGIGALYYFGEHGADSGLVSTFVKDIWAGLKTASPPVAMVMFFLYLRESSERREAQRQCNERTLDFVQATNKATVTLDRALQLMPRRRRR